MCLYHGGCRQCRASSCLSSIKVTSDGMDSLIALSQGDMRRALNILQVRKVRVPVMKLHTQADIISFMYIYIIM